MLHGEHARIKDEGSHQAARKMRRAAHCLVIHLGYEVGSVVAWTLEWTYRPVSSWDRNEAAASRPAGLNRRQPAFLGMLTGEDERKEI
jgi:hypothetical protein